MKLNVMERITLISLLPESGNFVTLKIVRKLRETLSFSEEEHLKLQFRYQYKCDQCGNEVFAPEVVVCGDCDKYMNPTDSMGWNPREDIEKEIHIGEKAKEIVIAILERKQGEDPDGTNDVHLTLYEKITGKEVE